MASISNCKERIFSCCHDNMNNWTNRLQKIVLLSDRFWRWTLLIFGNFDGGICKTWPFKVSKLFPHQNIKRPFHDYFQEYVYSFYIMTISKIGFFCFTFQVGNGWPFNRQVLSLTHDHLPIFGPIGAAISSWNWMRLDFRNQNCLSSDMFLRGW